MRPGSARAVTKSNLKTINMHAANDLKNTMLEISASDNLTHRDVSYIFSKLREILEANKKIKSTCKILNLFCNWSAHNYIEQSAVGYQALERISSALFDAISSTPAGSKDGIFLDIMKNSLNFGDLRNEIRLVFSQYKIRTSLIENQIFWIKFIHFTIHNLRDKPIRYSESALKGETKNRSDGDQIKSLRKLSQHKNSTDFGTMVSLSVSLAEDDFLFGEQKRGILIICTNKLGKRFHIAAYIPALAP